MASAAEGPAKLSPQGREFPRDHSSNSGTTCRVWRPRATERPFGPTRGGRGLMAEEPGDTGGVSRRTLLRLGAAGGAGAALVAAQGLGVPFLAQRGLLTADGVFAATSAALGDALFYIEAFPTSPLILNPFTDPLPIPQALRAGADGRVYSAWPAAGAGRRVSRTRSATRRTSSGRARSGSRTRSSTSSTCWSGRTRSPRRRCCRSTRTASPSQSFDAAGNTFPAGTVRTLPPSTIYGFNGHVPRAR